MSLVRSHYRPLRSGRSARSRELQQLDVVGLGRAAERPRQAEAVQRGLGYALDAWSVRRLALGVRVVGEAADLHRVLWRAVAGDPDQVQLQRLAQSVEAVGQLRLSAHAVIRPGRGEE